MTTPTFPESLPAPLLSGYGYQDDSGNVSKTPQSFGYQTQKQIGSNANTDFELSFIFSDSEMLIFENFVSEYLLAGHKWYVTDLDVGSGYVTHFCRIIGKYAAKTISNNTWKVVFGVETQKKQLVTASEYNSLIGYDTSTAFSFFEGGAGEGFSVIVEGPPEETVGGGYFEILF